MRPSELKREIERLIVDTSLARSTLGGLKQRLGEAMRMVEELRGSLGATPTSARASGDAATNVAAEGTPEPRAVQGDAGSA